MFEIATIPTVAHWFFVATIALLLTVAAGLSWAYLKGAQASVAVSFKGVEINLPFYARVIPLAQVVASKARIVNLDDEPALAPSIRTNGIGLPGYQVGWFRLKSKDKALLALTSRERVLFLPTTEGYVLLLSASDPDGLLSALRSYTNG